MTEFHTVHFETDVDGRGKFFIDEMEIRKVVAFKVEAGSPTTVTFTIYANVQIEHKKKPISAAKMQP